MPVKMNDAIYTTLKNNVLNKSMQNLVTMCFKLYIANKIEHRDVTEFFAQIDLNKDGILDQEELSLTFDEKFVKQILAKVDLD